MIGCESVVGESGFEDVGMGLGGCFEILGVLEPVDEFRVSMEIGMWLVKEGQLWRSLHVRCEDG